MTELYRNIDTHHCLTIQLNQGTNLNHNNETQRSCSAIFDDSIKENLIQGNQNCSKLCEHSFKPSIETFTQSFTRSEQSRYQEYNDERDINQSPQLQDLLLNEAIDACWDGILDLSSLPSLSSFQRDYVWNFEQYKSTESLRSLETVLKEATVSPIEFIPATSVTCVEPDQLSVDKAFGPIETVNNLRYNEISWVQDMLPRDSMHFDRSVELYCVFSHIDVSDSMVNSIENTDSVFNHSIVHSPSPPTMKTVCEPRHEDEFSHLTSWPIGGVCNDVNVANLHISNGCENLNCTRTAEHNALHIDTDGSVSTHEISPIQKRRREQYEDETQMKKADCNTPPSSCNSSPVLLPKRRHTEKGPVLETDWDKRRAVAFKECTNLSEVLKVNSYVGCLNIGIDYGKYTGRFAGVLQSGSILTNSYILHHSPEKQRSQALEVYLDRCEDTLLCGSLQRRRIVRDVSPIKNIIAGVSYMGSNCFSVYNPYEPQLYRFEVDDNGGNIISSKCGMCPYCPDVKFLPFKNSSYLSHLTLEHGILSNNYLIPNPVYFGRYDLIKSSPKTGITVKKEANAVQCPECFEPIEVGCWTMKENKLLSYFRHFKRCHGDFDVEVLRKKATQIPMIQARGRKLKVEQQFRDPS